MQRDRAGDAAANRALMDQIATPFAATRRDPWPPVVAFLETLAPGARVLDLAGGNGRHGRVAARRGHRPVVVDVSGRLVRVARSAARTEHLSLEAVEADAGSLPFGVATMDGAIFVAGVHCIRTRDARIRSLREMRTVLRTGAPALVTVWSAEQDRFRATVDRQREAWEAGRLPRDVEVGDVLVPWSRDIPDPVHRFFHVYDEEGLRVELEQADLLVDRIEPVTLTRASRPDNLFAYVHAP